MEDLIVAEMHALLGILYIIQRPYDSLQQEALKFSYKFLNKKDWNPIYDDDQVLEEKEQVIMNYIRNCKGDEFILQLNGLVEESLM